MDRNSIIGFVLIGVLLVGYIFYNQKSQQQLARQKAYQDSLANLNRPKMNAAVTVGLDSTTIKAQDSLQLNSQYGSFASVAKGTIQLTTVENDLVRISFTNRGAQPREVVLKKFKTYNGGPLVLLSGDYNQWGLQFTTSNGLLIQTKNLFFDPPVLTKKEDGTQIISYRVNAGSPFQYIEYSYTLRPGSYMLDVDIHTLGLEQVIAANQNSLVLNWQSQANQQEKDMANEKFNSRIYFRNAKQEVDYFTIQRTQEKKLDEPLQWVSFKQHFFNTTLIARNGFSAAAITANVNDSAVVAQSQITLTVPYHREHDFHLPLQMYYGPNHYTTLKSYNIGLENIIPLGEGLFAFVKYINKWLIIPVFNLLSKFVSNYGVIIIILTLIIRLLISPLTYRSYVSAAKMKVLKPELDELRAKYGDDQQKFGMEQMKLFRTAGVSPLGGCLPTLLQLPILIAMYNFFPSSIELRQQSFLWAKDLSTYDSIWDLPFQIPFYGNHVSLFTILMTATSLFLAFYNRNMTDQSNPAMKYMPYIFPVMLLGIFNKLAAALTFYYFLSNVIAILTQWVIQRFIIDEKKIHQQIQENKKKPVKKSKWQERLEEIQKRQQGIAPVSRKEK